MHVFQRLILSHQPETGVHVRDPYADQHLRNLPQREFPGNPPVMGPLALTRTDHHVVILRRLQDREQAFRRMLSVSIHDQHVLVPGLPETGLDRRAVPAIHPVTDNRGRQARPLGNAVRVVRGTIVNHDEFVLHARLGQSERSLRQNVAETGLLVEAGNDDGDCVFQHGFASIAVKGHA